VPYRHPVAPEPTASPSALAPAVRHASGMSAMTMQMGAARIGGYPERDVAAGPAVGERRSRPPAPRAGAAWIAGTSLAGAALFTGSWAP
jgi:hypothetical protein